MNLHIIGSLTKGEDYFNSDIAGIISLGKLEKGEKLFFVKGEKSLYLEIPSHIQNPLCNKS